MAYEDRLRQAIYRSPKGSIFTFQFDEVEISGGKKVAVHELPQQDGAEVQDLGALADKIPLTAYFSGADYDLLVDELLTALKERGPGSLQHPRYGDIPALPITWRINENLVDGIGRAEIKVEFIRVEEDVVFPLTVTGITIESIQSESWLTILSSTARSISDFVTTTAGDVARCSQNILATVDEYVQAYNDILAVGASISEAGAQLQAEAKLLTDKITNTIDTIIQSPTTLFNLLQEIIAIPGKIYTDVVSKIDAFIAYLSGTSATVPESEAEAVIAVNTTTAAISAAASAVTIGTIQSRQEAVLIAGRLQELRTIAQGFIETVESVDYSIPAADGSTSGYTVDPVIWAQAMDQLDKAIEATLERAYSLRSEVSYVTQSERTPLDLLYELYRGEVEDIDATLDEFIKTNTLVGEELFLIPAGRTVVYYE